PRLLTASTSPLSSLVSSDLRFRSEA
ncbi:uncharacterized protein METZ01_LOCUS115622, partial [marine metagenome]